MNTNKLYPRFAAERLKEGLADRPAVLIHGPRQSGKTTLARAVGEPLGYSYFSFDDPVLADAAKSDPIGFVDDLPERAILDEVQHAPTLFPALKMAIDARRVPGRFPRSIAVLTTIESAAGVLQAVGGSATPSISTTHNPHVPIGRKSG